MSASVCVYTYKDGLLARLAHDLQLTVGSFDVELSRGRVRASFELGSLRVDGVMRDGQVDTDVLSARDRRQILASAFDDVLDVAQHPTAHFEGQLEESSPARLRGTLGLRGRECPLEVDLSLGDQEAVARARLVPSRWGIPPFKALGGAIRLQDAIEVQARLPRPGDTSGMAWAELEHHYRVVSPPPGV